MSNPARMASLESTAIDLVQCSLAPATVRTYNATLSQFQSFLTALDTRYKGFPANSGQVLLYISDLYQQGLTAPTIQSKMSAITYYHKLMSLPDPLDSFIVQKALLGVKKLASSVDHRLPVTLSMLQQLMEKASKVTSSDYYTHMLRAMMCLSFFALLRPGEVTSSANNLLFENIDLSDQQITITFVHFKHHKGKPVTIVIPSQQHAPCPVATLATYIEARTSYPGPLFCHPGGRPISYLTYMTWFKNLLRYLGVRQVYGLHSFRIGAATLAASLNISSVMIQKMGRWQSNAYERYIRIPVIRFQ